MSDFLRTKMKEATVKFTVAYDEHKAAISGPDSVEMDEGTKALSEIFGTQHADIAVDMAKLGNLIKPDTFDVDALEVLAEEAGSRFSNEFDNDYIPAFAAVYVTDEFHGHNYPIGKVCVYLNNEDPRAVYINDDGKLEEGNNLWPDVMNLRPATDEEIETFAESVSEDDLFETFRIIREAA